MFCLAFIHEYGLSHNPTYLLLTGKKDRRCHYPEDDDFEDLSLADLRRLAELEKNKMEAVVFTHNDLCECCGEAGELLCCATCNLGKFAHLNFVSLFWL